MSMSRSNCLFKTLIVLLVGRAELATSEALHHTFEKPVSTSLSNDIVGLLHAGDAASLEKIDEKRGWKDNSMQVWGKRSHPLEYFGKEESALQSHNLLQESNSDLVERPSVRKWADSSLQVWGKRDAEERGQKRRWADNSMQVWGKRNNLSRSDTGSDEAKRKWSENSMAVWGKRDGNTKRKWSENEVRVWGKRNSDLDLSERTKRSVEPDVDPTLVELFKRQQSRWNGGQFGGPKRNWETNTMKVWGKRSTSSDWRRLVTALEALESLKLERDRERESSSVQVKRAWSSDNGLGIWGKRSAPDDLEDWTD